MTNQAFSQRINRSSRPFQVERGHDIRERFNGLSAPLLEVLAGAGGSSPYLFSLLERETDWVRDILDASPEAAFQGVLNEIHPLTLKQLPDGLRCAKGRVALLTALCDLAGVWSLGEVTQALTSFADLSVESAVRSLVAAEIDRGKLPGAADVDKETSAGMVVLAMGKMGAGELNYSSDIDLICLFDESRFDPADQPEARASFIRVTRRLYKLLSDNTGAGYVFRTDLRLRPDPSVTPVCLSMGAAEGYYESVGRTWERAAHIKARVCAGDHDAGNAYLKRLTPFVWRKHLDFAAIDDAHDMRLRIRAHRQLHGPIVLENHNMKLGAGGIREIEFFTQTRQIISGGRDADLRARGTLDGLQQLAAKGWVPDDAAKALSQDYVAHREVEHRLQMVADAQTHTLPKDDEGFERIAALSGREVQEMRADISDRLNRVFDITEGFFAPSTGVPVLPDMTETMVETIDRWENYPALRSPRAGEIFQRLMPEIVNRLQKAARPDEALIQFDAFLAGLPSGVQVFSMFEANPQLIDLIVDIAATAPRLAQYLGRNAQVFDAVIGGGFFADWPEHSDLQERLTNELNNLSDYEGKLDAARRFMKEWHFRIGVHHLRCLIDAEQSGQHYASLADAVLGALWPIVSKEFSRKHGDAPGRGAVILGMGSLGSQRLNAASDLDLIVIYDAQGVDTSSGRRPLASRAYYARLTQALVTAISAQMSEGRLYEVDMRLRPSGRQGPVATAFEAFVTYQNDDAWTWEHLALTRARPIAGNSGLADEIEGFRCNLLQRDNDRPGVLADVRDMRARLSEAKPGQGVWDAKQGPGKLQDIELLAQTCALLAGSKARGVLDQLQCGEQSGLIDSTQFARLCDGFELLGELQAAARLLSGELLDIDGIGQGGRDFLLRVTGTETTEDLSDRIENLAADCNSIIKQALGTGENPA